MEVKFKKLSDKAVIPYKAHPTDAGFDMTAVGINKTEDYIEYKTDIAIQLPKGYCALLFPRSSNSKMDLLMANSVGLVDEGYIGEIRFRFKRMFTPNLTFRDDHIYKVGDRIGQLVIIPIPEITLVETDKLTETDRGEGGFGSTNSK